MNSNHANLFLAIQQHIAALKDGDNNPYFRFVDQDLGQLEQERPPVSWPCVLIDIDDTTYTSLQHHVQQGVATVMLRIGFPPFSSSSSITPAAYRQQALQCYNLEQLLYIAFQGKAPAAILPDDAPDSLVDGVAYFSAFTRTRAATEQRPEDFIRVRILTFTIGFEDYTAKQYPTYTPAAPDFSTSFNFPA